MGTFTIVEGLNCVGHDGPHKLGLHLRIGTSGPTAGHVALHALHHAFVGEEEENEATVELARAVLTRAVGPDPDVTDEEATALITAVESAREYMIDNHYADQEDGEQEARDAYMARLLEPGNLVNICWVGRSPVR